MAALIRRTFKFLVERVSASLPRTVPDGGSLILCYHNVVQDAEAGLGDSSLHLAASKFERQLELAAAVGDVVSLPDLLANHGRPGCRIAFTFDDAYRGCIRLGLPLCTAARVRPAVFVAPGLLGSFPPWDVASQHGHWTEADRASFLSEGGVATARQKDGERAGLPDDYAIATESELLRAIEHHAFDIANHTNRHVNLAQTERQLVLDEIRNCEATLAAKFPDRHMPRSLAYPYGKTPRVDVAEIIDHGFLVSGGWLSPHEPAFGQAIPRLNVPAGISDWRFAAQLRGRLVG